jgi:hypothetical protein
VLLQANKWIPTDPDVCHTLRVFKDVQKHQVSSNVCFQARQIHFCIVFVFVLLLLLLVLLLSLVWFCSAKFNTQPYWQDEHTGALLPLTLYLSGQSTSRAHNTVTNLRSIATQSIGRTSPATKWMGRTSAQVGRPSYRPSQQQAVLSTKSTGPVWICRTIDRVDRSYQDMSYY